MEMIGSCFHHVFFLTSNLSMLCCLFVWQVWIGFYQTTRVDAAPPDMAIQASVKRLALPAWHCWRLLSGEAGHV